MYFVDEYVNDGRVRQDFPHIHSWYWTLGLQYVFMDQGDVIYT